MCSVLAVVVEEAIDPEAEKAVDILSMKSRELIEQLMDLNNMERLTEQQSNYKEMLIKELKFRKISGTL